MIGLVGFILWLFVAGAVLGFLFWSVFIGMAQRKAWTEFARRYKLEVTQGDKFRDPVSVTGMLNGRLINIYSQIEHNDEERTQRVYTHVEVFLNDFPSARFILSKGALPLEIADIVLEQPFVPSMPDWPTLQHSFTDDVSVLGVWFSPVRVRALKAFMGTAEKGVEVLFIGAGDSAFMLWRGVDPLTDPRKLNALVQKLYGYARDFDAGSTGISAKPNASSEMAPEDKPA